MLLATLLLVRVEPAAEECSPSPTAQTRPTTLIASPKSTISAPLPQNHPKG